MSSTPMKCCFYLEDLEAGDVEHADEVLPLVLGVQRLVDATDEPGEHARVQRLRQRLHRELHLVLVLTFRHHLVADLDLGLQQRLEKVSRVDAEQEGYLLRLCKTTVAATEAVCLHLASTYVYMYHTCTARI